MSKSNCTKQMQNYVLAANNLCYSELTETFPEPDVNAVWASWKSLFLSLVTNCIPSRVVTIMKSLPWLNADIIRLLWIQIGIPYAGG